MKLLLILFICLSTYYASACECVGFATIGKNFEAASFVLKVEVVGFNDTVQVDNRLSILPRPYTSGYSARLRILKTYKGDIDQNVIALVNSQHCGVKLDLEKEYVLFIYDFNGNFGIRICEKNFPTSDKSSMDTFKTFLKNKRHLK